jgi:hypothetical protein
LKYNGNQWAQRSSVTSPHPGGIFVLYLWGEDFELCLDCVPFIRIQGTSKDLLSTVYASTEHQRAFQADLRIIRIASRVF